MYTWPNHIYHVDIVFGNKTVEMRVYEGETGTCPPVAEEAWLDVLRCNVVFEEDVGLQENHRYAYCISKFTFEARSGRVVRLV